MPPGLDIGRILGQYSGTAGTSQHLNERAGQDFDEIAPNASQQDMRDGLTEAFRSGQTPPFGDIISQVFADADSQQRTGMLNQLLSGASGSVLGSVTGGGALGGLSGLLSRGSGGPVTLSPEQATQIDPGQVRELADRAAQDNPGIIDKMSDFLAQNPALVKGLGGPTVAVILGKMAQRKH